MTTPDAPFDAPWQAQLFAMTLALNEQGLFTWSEWAETFGPRVQDREAARYWDTWSEALVALLDQKGIAAPEEISALTKRWQQAALMTPHGASIDLANAGEPGG